MVTDLLRHLEGLKYDKSARVLVLNSAVPGVFCVGADLKERLEMQPEEVTQFVDSLRTSFTKLEQLPIPTIACIEGFALGGGLEIALACDMRIAARTSVLGLPETSLAIFPGAGGTQRLPRIVGLARAKEMIFTAQRYSAEQALQYNLVNEVVDEARARTQQLAQIIASNGPVGVRMAKKAIDLGFDSDLQSGLEIEKLCYAPLLNTEDRIEALKAFKEKRKPQFKGC
jgi:methylglutaconyl-CoA hydratase